MMYSNLFLLYYVLHNVSIEISYLAGHVEGSTVTDVYVDVSPEYVYDESNTYCITIALLL